MGLTPAERERNAHHVAVRRSAIGRVRDRRVVLVDDIITTGASVRAARSALELAGAKVVAVVALCAAERRDALGESEGVTAKLTAKLD
ncbi:phosphoribosyltransferase family protein [Leucobacter sp. NPDC058333]|uniref:phosphoribosyltransferase family protein n=1 Tax=Leucobacter sp. NPDC058333 TaxID=3346450 RepID=UPI00365D2A05